MRYAVLLVVSACSFHPGALGDAPGPASGSDAPAIVGDAPVADTSPDAMPAPDALAGLRWLMPCTSGDLGNQNCNCGAPQAQTVTIGGTPDQHWMVTVRIRGAMEEMDYAGGAATGATGWYVGGTPGDTVDNTYELAVSSPAQHYWINSGTPGCNCSHAYDYTATFPIDGGATVTFTASGQDTLQWGNYDSNGAPITFPGVTTTPSPYDGQFAQLDVQSAMPTP